MPPFGSRFSGGAKTKFNLKATIKQLAHYYRNYKKLFIVAVFLSLIAGICSTAAVILNGYIYCWYIIPSIIPTMLEGHYDTFELFSFCWFCGGLLLTYLISNGLNWLESYILLKMSEGGSYNLRSALFSKLNNLPISYFDRTPSGDIMSRSINDVDNIGQAMSQNLGNIIYWIFMIFSMLIVIFLINPVLACFSIILIPLFMSINLLIMSKVRPHFARQQKSLGDLNGFVEERVSGLKIVSLFKLKDKSEDSFKLINRQLTRNSVIAQAVTGIMMPMNIFMQNMSFVILVAIASVGLFSDTPWIKVDWGVFDFKVPQRYIDVLPNTPESRSIIDSLNKLSLLLIFTQAARTLNNPINQLISSLGQLFLGFASASRVLDIINQAEEKDDENVQYLEEVYGLVEAEDMDFCYQPEKPILEKINFCIKPNMKVALVGPTGAGKTTIVNLITRFYDITGGDLRIDGISIKNINRRSLRKNITMVLQDTFLFSTSIMENIRYGRLEATNDEIIEAAKKARAHNFIMQLPQGYETILEDNGSNLSQGQRQLLAIARAFLSNAKIVILDEATSSIDTKTEIEIQKAMFDLMLNRTSFTIAHRLSTIRNADLILVINQGKIVEQGNHDQLLNKQEGFYAKLYNSQFQGIDI